MLLLLLSLLLACSSDDEVTPSAPEPVEAGDPCCDPGEPGEARWESCEDQTVLSHVCKRAEICCTVQWAEPCAAGYARFAATCAVEDNATVGPGTSPTPPTGGGPPTDGSAATGEGALPGQPEPPQTRQQGLLSLDDSSRVKVVVKVDVVPPPDTPGGHVFYGGFVEIDETVNMPVRDSRPADYGAVAQWVQGFPVEAELELYDGLHYFVMYGFGDHPQPGDRMAALQKVSGAGTMTYVIGPRTIPREGEVPEGGFAPGTEPDGPPGSEGGDDEEPPPPPPGEPPPGGEPEIPPGDAGTSQGPGTAPPPPGEPPDDGKYRPGEGPDAGAPPDGVEAPPPGDGQPPGEPGAGG